MKMMVTGLCNVLICILWRRISRLMGRVSSGEEDQGYLEEYQVGKKIKSIGKSIKWGRISRVLGRVSGGEEDQVGKERGKEGFGEAISS